jgi:AcrR family transcriptional regulator
MRSPTGRKRAEKPRPRGSQFIRKVQDAVIEQLAAVGFQRLSIPEVAARAGVNKTSVYRRWPTKAALVRAALEVSMGGAGPASSTGGLRTDLVHAARLAAQFVQSPLGTGALRMLLAEGANPDVREVAASMLRRQETEGPRALFDLAITRGELPPDTDVQLVLSTVAGALMHRAFIEQKPLSGGFVDKVVDLVLDGASRSRPKRQHARPRVGIE